MRAAISLLALSLVFGSLAVNYEAFLTRLSIMLIPNFSSDFLIAGTNKPKPNQPENPIPHRGSGRRSFSTYLGNFPSVA